MAYIELHQALFDHRKTMTAANSLGIPEVHLVGHLASLWAWSLDNCPDGLLPEMPRVCTRGARYEGDAEIFVRSLVVAGFLDEIDGRLWIHDWQDYGGKLIEKRRNNAEKQARYRDRQDTPPTPKPHVTTTLPSRDALEKSREEKRRVEKSITPPLSPSAEVDPPKPKPQRVIKTSVPENLLELMLADEDESSKSYEQIQNEQSMSDTELRLETRKMIDHFRSKGERRVDWFATWRNWMRSEYRKPRLQLVPNGRSPNGTPSALDFAERARELEGLDL